MKTSIVFTLLLPVLFLPFNGTVLAQTAGGADSARLAEESAAFDFWIGDWDLEWYESDSSLATGGNVISRLHGGHVIGERFTVLTGSQKGYTGESWSVYNPRTREWKQTWVDNQGSYLDFTGEITNGDRIFSRTVAKSDGSVIHQRMAFRKREKDSFVWDWESSTDGGKTWDLKWEIFYHRKK